MFERKKFFADWLYRFMKVFTWVENGFMSFVLVIGGIVAYLLLGDTLGSIAILIHIGTIVLAILSFGANWIGRWVILARLENYIANIETRNKMITERDFDIICESNEDSFLYDRNT